MLGLAWKVERKGRDRAHAKPESGDTVEDLAKLIRFDNKDYRKWLKPVGPTRMPGSATKPISGCAEFTIPNTIHIDFGVFKVGDQIPILAIIQVWRSGAMKDKADWEGKGFYVPVTEGVTDEEIINHLGSPNTHGYVFIGHGYKGLINTYTHHGEDTSGLGPDRYTSHGIAFLTLKACSSAHPSGPKKRYKHNPWESNVATRGWFVGYTGNVITWNESFLWTSASGKNDKGYGQ